MIRGIEENFYFMKFSQDIIRNISFSLGAMQGTFFSDGIQSKRDAIPYDCIMAGLMKVAHHELSLPQDTFEVQEYLNGLPKDLNPVDLLEKDRCKFFTCYGIMKGLQPGLQGYIHEITGKSEQEAPADYEAYAAGFAMVVRFMSLDVKQGSGQGPYGYGVLFGSQLIMQPLPFQFTTADFLDGCYAGAGLKERKITVEDSDRIFSVVSPAGMMPTIIQQSGSE